MTYRSNQEFMDSQKRVRELTIYLDGVKHCTISDDDLSAQLIKTITDCYPDMIVRVEKGEK